MDVCIVLDFEAVVFVFLQVTLGIATLRRQKQSVKEMDMLTKLTKMEIWI